MKTRILYLVVIGILFAGLLYGEYQWIPIGPDGGFLYSFEIAPSSSSTLYAGCDAYGGIYKSTDSGENWEFLGLLSDIAQVLDIDVHPDSSNIVYATCGRAGVYKTTDGGLNWVNVFKKDKITYSFGIDPNSPDKVYAGVLIDSLSEYGIYISTDGGATWPDSSLLGYSAMEICFDPDSLNTIYAGTFFGVHRSTDGGNIWNFLGPPSPSASVFSIAVADFNTFYAGTHPDERDTGAVYRTTDGGNNWDTSYVLGANVNDLAVDPDSNNILYMAGGNNLNESEGIYKTTDGGDTWFPVNNGLVDRMAVTIDIDPTSPNIIYAGTNGLGGVYKSTDKALNWTNISSGMRHTPLDAICFDASNTMYAVVSWGTYKDIPCIFRSDDYGITWDTLRTVPSPYFMTSIWDIVAHPDSDDVIYVGGMSHYSNTTDDSTLGLLYKSVDGGQNWIELWTPDKVWIMCLAIDSVSGNIYAGTAGPDTARIYKLYRSTDNGNAWDETSGWDYKINGIMDIVIDPSSPNILYAGTAIFVYKSTDYGASWTAMQAIPSCYTLLVDPDSSNIIYAGSGGPGIDSGGVYKSTNYGVSWSMVGLDGYSIYSLAGSFGSSDTLYAGTGGKFLENTGKGVFRSLDNGVTWDSINSGLTVPFILTLEIDPNSSDKIYAGTLAGGIYKYTDEESVEESPEDYVNDREIWLSVFPNPFSEQTTINLHGIGHRAEGMELRIYDLSGRLVRSFDLTSSILHPISTLTWDGDSNSGKPLRTGVYFIRLKTRTQSVIKKCLYIK